MAAEIEHVHPACPECLIGKIYVTGDNDALICSRCRTVFIPTNRIHC